MGPGLIGEPIYCIDASSWIDAEHYHALDIFPSLWTRLEALLGRMRTPRQAVAEVGDGSNGVSAWLRTNKGGLVVNERQSVMTRAGAIMVAYPKLSHGATHNFADPWVIAHAEENGWIVVCEETKRGPTNPAIPDICGVRSVKCIGWVRMLRELEISI